MQERFVPISETGYLLSGTIEGTVEGQSEIPQAAAQQHDPSILPQASNYPGYFDLSYDQPGPSTSIEMPSAVPCPPPVLSYYPQHPHQQQQQHYYGYSEMMPPTPYQQFSAGQLNQPEIKILIQPTNRMRFRYGSEKGSHGALTGSQDKKSFPTVKLENYIIKEKPAFIRASLYTNDREPKLHVHRFKGPYCEEGMCIVQVEKESMTAVFQNLSIEFIGKKEVANILYERKLRFSNIPSNQYASTGSCDILESSKKEANKMNLNVVRICFEAVVQDPHTRTWHSLGEKIFSEPIYNQKATETGELKIVRMDKCSGSCAGGDEIFLLCDKVNKKDIKIQFYEEKNGKIIWEDWGQFTEADVHYQVAIVFQTPPYRLDISESVDVLIRLYRMSDQETSEPRKFSYQPKEQDKEGVETKRRKVAYSSRPTEGLSGYKTSPSSPYSTSSLSSGEFGPQKKSESGGMDEISPELSEEISKCLDNMDFDFDYFVQHSPLLKNIFSDPVLASTSSVWQPNTIVKDSNMDSRHQSQGNLFSDSVREQDHLSDTMSELSLTESSSSHVTVTGHPATDGHKLTIKREGDRLNSYDQSVIDIEKKILGKLHLLIEVCVYKFGSRILTELQKQTNQGKGLAMFYALQSLLLEKNKDGDNALHLALIHENEDEQILFKLIEVMKNAPGDAVNVYNNAHQTALHLAVMCKKPSHVLCLLSAGAKQDLKDKNGDTAVHIAASLGETECLKILLSSKYSSTTKLNDLNYSGKAPLHLAVEKNDHAAVELLCAPGSDINIADGKSGKTPLHYAARASLAIVSILLKQDKIEVNLQDYGGNTPLHLACAQGAEEIVLQLMQNNADPLIKNHSQDGNELHSDAEESIFEKGKTAFDYAENNKKILAILNGKYDERPLSNLDAFNSENSCIQTETLSTKETFIEQKQDFKATPNPFMKTTEEKSNNESQLLQCDSGYQSREIQYLDNSLLRKLCQMLDPPNHGWEQLAEILVDKNKLKFLRTKKSPTKTALRLHKGTMEEFARIVEISGLTDVSNLLQDYL